MTRLLGRVWITILLVFVSDPAFSLEYEVQKPLQNEVVSFSKKSEVLEKTCLDEYAARNKYLKRFVFWAPPTAIVSVPYIWISIFSDSLASAVAFIFVGIPVFSSLTIAFEIKNTIEYFSNRSVIRVVDALRFNDFENEHVKKFIHKFRTRFPESQLADNEIFDEILRLDQNEGLCNGDLTGSRSSRMRKLLAKNKHLFIHLSQL